MNRKLVIVCLIPIRYDFLCASILDGLNQLNHEFYCDQLTNNATEQNYIQPEKILPQCKRSDFILIFSNTDYQKRKRFIMSNALAKKTVYIDGSDHNYFEDPDGINIWPAIFKRENPVTFEYTPYKIKSLRNAIGNVVKCSKDLRQYFLVRRKSSPLPFAAEKAYFRFSAQPGEKDINIACLLRGYPNKRHEINKMVEGLKIPNTIIGAVSNSGWATDSWDTAKNEYYKTLSRSKISISFPGTGFDTGRFWEILANKCLLFSPPLNIRMPDPFIKFKHFVPYNNLNELKNRLHYYLQHNQEREQIALEGYKHLIKYHTSKKRAEYLLNTINRKKVEAASRDTKIGDHTINNR